MQMKGRLQVDQPNLAAGNIVSMKMIMEVPGVSDLVARINELLPPQIHVWSFVG
jgi:tRNA pseudouridine38-40 synthase